MLTTKTNFSNRILRTLTGSLILGVIVPGLSPTAAQEQTTVRALARSAAATGVLGVHADNPRYFGDGSGRAIYLAGHQSFVDLQDNSFNKPFTRDKQRRLDWDAYLDFLSEQHFNYLRNWVIWSTGSGSMAPVNQAIAAPMPYRRVVGKGRARDGGDRFDLDQFDEGFFRRMRRRCEDLQSRGIYVSIMLFEVYGFLEGEAAGEPAQTLWDGNLFNRNNNANGIDADDNGDGIGIEFFYTTDERLLAIQRAYVAKVIDTVNPLDNVLFEVANELHAPDWQDRMIQFIKDYERNKPKQHLVLMSPGGRTRTGQWQQMPRETLLTSPADCFAVASSWNSGACRRQDPPANNTGKPGILDLDHVSPGSTDIGFVWSAFTRGYHFSLYDKPFERPDAEGPEWRRIRRSVGQTLAYAERMDLTHAVPHGDLANTGYCLANRGHEYLVYAPNGGTIIVDLSDAKDAFRLEWFDPTRATSSDGGNVSGGGPRTFVPAFDGPAVLFLAHESSNPEEIN